MIRKALFAALLVLAGCSGQPTDPSKPEAYAYRAPIGATADGSVQQLTLPPAAVAAIARSDLGDIRVLDGNGRPLSLARVDSAGASANTRDNQVEAIPIAASGHEGQDRVSARVAQAGQDVTVDAVNAEAEAESHPQAALLLDTRRLEDPAIALLLDGAIEKGRIGEVTVASSGDLKTWEPLGSKMLFGAGDKTDLRLNLPGVPLKDRYVRISWQLDEGIIIRGARVTTAKTLPPSPLVFATKGAQLVDSHNLQFQVPLNAPIIGFKVTGQRGEGVIPVALEERDSIEAPWAPVAHGALRNGDPVQLDMKAASDAGKVRSYRLVADPRSSGFTGVPKIEVLTEPIVMLAAFNGKGPYLLAAGNKNAEPKLFRPGELLGPSPPSRIPEATVAAARDAVELVIAPDGQASPLSPRKLALWAALLGATAMLAFAALRLARANQSPLQGDQP